MKLDSTLESHLITDGETEPVESKSSFQNRLGQYITSVFSIFSILIMVLTISEDGIATR